jgi:transcriptional regulator
MGMAQKIRILLVKQGNISERELARRLETTAGNLSQKMKRDNFSENELRAIADVMCCDVEINFINRETGEKT